MKTTIDLGKAAYQGTRKINRVALVIELSDGPQPKLSICGEIWNSQETDCLSCGQNIDEIAKLFSQNKQVQRLREIWERYHLNDMKAGCAHQRRDKWDERPIDPAKPTNSYGLHFPGQKSSSWNMLTWVSRAEHPQGLLSEPCPECGYKYGTAWLYEEIPAEIISEIKQLAA